jgi:hypothetical protein
MRRAGPTLASNDTGCTPEQIALSLGVMTVCRRRTLVALIATLAAGCRDEAGEAPAPTATEVATPLLEAAAEDEDPADAGPQKHGEAGEAGARVPIPAGTASIGSTPGDRGRDPSLEPAMMTLELGAFEIDRLPHPNDPAARPLTGVTRDEAASLCADRGSRLCSEIEWERACKGPAADPYAGGKVWDPACADGTSRCASGFDVLSMGALREWTASEVAPIKNVVPAGSAAVRGAAKQAADVDHRCAHRAAAAPTSASDDIGFRCCRGEAPPATIPSPGWSPKVKRVEFSTTQLAELFRASERLAPFASDIKWFNEKAAAETVVRRGKTRGAGNEPASSTELYTSPLVWSPVPGEQILLVTGQSGKDSFIVAFHELPGGRYRVASAMLMKNEIGPVVIVDDQGPSRKLLWTTCWECHGESGNITYRSENRVVITQQ